MTDALLEQDPILCEIVDLLIPTLHPLSRRGPSLIPCTWRKPEYIGL